MYLFFYRVTFLSKNRFKIRFLLKVTSLYKPYPRGIRTDNIQFVAQNALEHAKTEEIIKKLACL